jgi:WD40 repeat protein
LLQVRGHDGELHLVLAQVEAFTEDEESVRELLAYRSLEDRPGSADQVKIEGDRVEGGKARFRLRGYLPLVQLTAGERTGDPSSRVEVGKPRPQGRSSGATSAGLAEYLRNHPRSAASVSFDGVFKGFTSPAARVSPAPGDSRTAQIEFAGVPAQAFSDYQRDALVTVEAVVSGKSTPQALVLVGTAICLKDDPTSRITGAGWMTPARDLRKMLDMWRAARSDPESHLQERLEMAGVYGGSSQESGSQSMEIQVGKICGSSEDLKATCPPSAEVSRFLGQLTLGERVLFEAVVVGGRRHRPRIGLLWIARWSQQDQRVRFFPENDAPGIPGAELRCFGETTQEVRLVAWSADGSLLAGAREDGTVSVWEAETGKLVRSFSSQDPTSGSAKTAVYDLAWRPESKELAAVVGESVNAVRRRNPLGAGKQSGAAEAEAVVVWDLTQDPQAPQEPSTFPCPGIRSLSWSPDGTRLAVAGGTDAFVLRVLDLEKGKFSSLSPPKTQGAGFAVAWSPNGSCVAAAHRRPGMVSIWDVAKPRRVGVLPPERAQPTQKPQEKKTRDPRAVTGSRRSGQRPGRSPSSSTPLPVPSYPGVLDRSRLTNLPEIEFPYDSGPRAVAWSPDSSRLAIASRKNLEVWDVPATDQEDPAQKIENERLGFRSYEDLRAVVWSPDGSRLAASAQSSYNLVLLEVDTAEAELVLESGGRVNDLAFSPDGARLATAHGDGKIRVWSTPIKKPRAEEQ